MHERKTQKIKSIPKSKPRKSNAYEHKNTNPENQNPENQIQEIKSNPENQIQEHKNTNPEKPSPTVLHIDTRHSPNV